MEKNKAGYNAYGIWRVTTEGDCEGRSTRELGTHEGFIDEIAFALADKCYYSLTFKPENRIIGDRTPKKDTVSVSLDIDSGTWDMRSGSRVEFFRKMLSEANRKGVYVEEGQYYASVKLSLNVPLTPEQKMIQRLKDAGFDPGEVIRTFKQR